MAPHSVLMALGSTPSRHTRLLGRSRWQKTGAVLASPAGAAQCDEEAPRRYLTQAVRKGPHFVESPEQASVVLVNDYCHKLLWLAYTHSETGTQARAPARRATTHPRPMVGIAGGAAWLTCSRPAPWKRVPVLPMHNHMQSA